MRDQEQLIGENNSKIATEHNHCYSELDSKSNYLNCLNQPKVVRKVEIDSALSKRYLFNPLNIGCIRSHIGLIQQFEIITMSLNPQYLNYKLQPQEQSESYDNPSSSSRKFKVKQLLRRYRNESPPDATEEDNLKAKLLNSYQKLQSQLTQNQKLKESLSEMSAKYSQVVSQNTQLKTLLQKVIENRKHLEREFDQITKSNQKMKQDLQVSSSREDELIEQNNHLRHSYKQLNQDHESTSRQIKTLEAIIIQRDLSIDRLTQSIRAMSNSQHYSWSQEIAKENPNSNLNNQNQQPNRSKSKSKTRQRQFKVGKWKKNMPTIEAINLNQSIHQDDQQNRISIQNNPQPQQETEAILRNDDEMLTQQQNKKKHLDDELAKLMRIKKPAIYENKRIQEIQNQLYRVESTISRLKRKIRSKY